MREGICLKGRLVLYVLIFLYLGILSGFLFWLPWWITVFLYSKRHIFGIKKNFLRWRGYPFRFFIGFRLFKWFPESNLIHFDLSVMIGPMVLVLVGTYDQEYKFILEVLRFFSCSVLMLVAGGLVVFLFLQSLLMVYNIFFLIFESIGGSMGGKGVWCKVCFGR